ncbi:MAK10-like protein [Tanacetum coccineum]
MTIIGTKWVFRNKLDENNIVSRNKARLVSQGYNQQEGINYDETYAPVARLESIRILLSYACALDFKLFQMDVKSAFLNGLINDEVYVAQPPGFIDFEKPDHVYKLKKALYGLKQASKAWFLALGWNLEDIHMTWAHLEKKRTRLRTYNKSLRRKAYRDENPIRTLGDYSKPSYKGYRNTIELPKGNNLSVGGKLRDRNAKESWALLEDLTLYDNESWNDPKDFAKPVKTISLPQDVPSTSDRRLIELENQVQRLMEAYLAPKQHVQVNKISSSCEICSGPHDTQYCMENPEQAFVDYASSRTDKAGEKSNPENIDTTPPSPPDPSISLITEKIRKLNSFLEFSGLIPQSLDTKFVCTKGDDGDVVFVEIIKKNDDPQEEGPENKGNSTTEGLEAEYFDTFPTRSELAYHKYLMSGLIPSLFLRSLIITEGCPSNLKILCNIGNVHVEKTYIDLNSPLNVMTRMMYNWIMRIKLDPREDASRRVSNFTGRIKGMHVFVGNFEISNFTGRIKEMHIFIRNFTYVSDFMIVEDISSIIDPRLSQVVLGKPFVEISNITHDLSLGVVKFTNRSNEIAYKMPHKIVQYNSLSDMEKRAHKSVYLRNKKEKRRGVEYGKDIRVL